MSVSERVSRMLRQNALRWPWPTERKPLVIEHVRYTKRPSIDPLDKALAMARQMNRPDLIGKVEAVRGGR